MNLELSKSKRNKVFNNNDGEQPNNSLTLTNDLPKGSPLRFHSAASTPKRPTQLFSPNHLNYENNNLESFATWRSPSSSDDDNSPTQMNNCRKLIEKAPLVKRLSISLLRSNDEYRPLLGGSYSSSYTTTSSTANVTLSSSETPTKQNYLTSSTTHIPSSICGDAYANDMYCDAEEMISSKFGDSCRKSLTSMLDNRRKDYCDFESVKRSFRNLRETSSANSSPKMFANAKQKRIRGLSIIEQHELRDEPWFQIGVPREISLEVLRRKNPGEFLVRESSTKPGCFALSLRAPPPAPKVVHYLILRTPRGYKIKGCAKEFSTLKALITHHSVMPEQLPVPLALERPRHLLAQRRNLDDFDTYESVSNFQKLVL